MKIETVSDQASNHPSSPHGQSALRDASTTIGETRRRVAEFVAERHWGQFHSPKNLSMALAIEAAELMEHFQWVSPEESRAAADAPDRRQAIQEELADVFCYVLALANELQVDLAQSLADKMAKNARKYPVAEFRGRFGPDDPRPATSD